MCARRGDERILTKTDRLLKAFVLIRASRVPANTMVVHPSFINAMMGSYGWLRACQCRHKNLMWSYSYLKHLRKPKVIGAVICLSYVNPVNHTSAWHLKVRPACLLHGLASSVWAVGHTSSAYYLQLASPFSHGHHIILLDDTNKCVNNLPKGNGGVRLGLGPQKCRLAPTAKHAGQASRGELYEIFEFWSFLQSKSVNNVWKLLQVLGDFRP